MLNKLQIKLPSCGGGGGFLPEIGRHDFACFLQGEQVILQKPGKSLSIFTVNYFSHFSQLFSSAEGIKEKVIAVLQKS